MPLSIAMKLKYCYVRSQSAWSIKSRFSIEPNRQPHTKKKLRRPRKFIQTDSKYSAIINNRELEQKKYMEKREQLKPNAIDDEYVCVCMCS